MKISTEPAYVRRVLDYYERHGHRATVAEFDFTSNQWQRWIKVRKELGPEWPTWEMQVEWKAAQDARRHHRALKAEYRKQRILVGKTMINATGTTRRIQALQRLGWSHADIAKAADLPKPTVSELPNRKLVKRETAKRIDVAYARLSMTLGPSVRSARHAESKGWPPPLAWDRIDDPREHPKGIGAPKGRLPDELDPVIVDRLLLGERVLSTRAEKEEAMRRWIADGKSAVSLCRLHGWQEGRYNRDALTIARRRRVLVEAYDEPEEVEAS